MRFLGAVVFIGIAVVLCSAVSVDKAPAPAEKLERIEADLAKITKFLRHSMGQKTKSKQGKSDMLVKAELGAKSKHPTVALQQQEPLAAVDSQPQVPVSATQNAILPGGDETNPLDVTISMFPPSQSVPGKDNIHLNAGAINGKVRFRAVARSQLPMPEATADTGIRLHSSKDAVTCPGFPEECSNNGMCNGGICMCDAIHTGPDCSLLRCLPTCSENGLCMNGTCACAPGWTGPSCDVVTCFPECGEHGKCVEGVCECAPGFWGSSCEELLCPGKPQCTGHLHGVCDTKTGLCNCSAEWGGKDCSLPVYTCVFDCHNGGHCNNGTCVCASGFSGSDCTTLLPPKYACEGGSVWSVSSSLNTRTCKNIDSPVIGQNFPVVSVPKCSCPKDTPIWDERTRQCVEEAFCHVGVCGEMESPKSTELTLKVKTKSVCSWTKPIPSPGTCHGCVDAFQPVTVCYKAGHDVAQRIMTALEVHVVLIRRGGPCPGETYPYGPGTTIANITNTTVASNANETSVQEDKSSLYSTTTVIHSQRPNLAGLPRVMLASNERNSVGSVNISVACGGFYTAHFVIVDHLYKADSFGTCGINAENSSCPGAPACSKHGRCKSDYSKSACVCDTGYIGEDCSATVEQVGNKTISNLPHGISTALPIPPTARINTTATSVIVSHDNLTYVFYPNGTTEVHTLGSKDVVVINRDSESSQKCKSNTVWSSCSPGCVPSCRNPNPRCMPTCLIGSCQCPQDYPLWDEVQGRCVPFFACAPQSPCPGIGVVCSNKGICFNDSCVCMPGFSGKDCSNYGTKANRVTTKSGTLQEVTPCHFPFEFRGRIYNDCTTDFDSEGKEWCSASEEWEQEWGYCAPRGACPEVNGVVCNGRGECVDGVCKCEPLYSGIDCSLHDVRYTNQTFEECQFPFLGPGKQEYNDCIPGIPVPGDDGLSIASSSPSKDSKVSWCLTSTHYEGPDSVGFCQPKGSCGNCSREGGICDPRGSGKCICKPGYSDRFCDKKLTEREILVKFFVATNGAEWTRKTGWAEPTSPCDNPSWIGLTCRDGHVVRINLDSSGLTGSVPADLAALSHLEVIDLSSNRLSGTFPEAILRIESLRTISASGNMLVGATPIIPARIIYADFSQNYMRPPRDTKSSVVSRVTNGKGSVPAYTPCHFPFEFYGRNYTSCTSDWSASETAWCSTTPEFEGKWGLCADVGTCQGSNGTECSGHGTCVVIRTATGAAGGECRCDDGYRGVDCSEKIVRVTLSIHTGESLVNDSHVECNLPFEYNGKIYHDCTTDDSSSGSEWCLLSPQWERKWGLCAKRGVCPGETPCSGHGTCEQGACLCEQGWISADCSRTAPRVTLGTKQKANLPCSFPFTVNGVSYDDCAVISDMSDNEICALESGELTAENRWDECAPYGTCAGTPTCSNNGVCNQGECVCNPGFSGVDCSQSLGHRELLIKFFQATHGEHWTDSSGWEVHRDFCTWVGVFCNDQRDVVGISLPNNNLDGVLPPEVALFATLKSLDVSNNKLAGVVPPALGNHPSLELLNLSNNQFVGRLPQMVKATAKCDATCIESAVCSKGTCSFSF